MAVATTVMDSFGMATVQTLRKKYAGVSEAHVDGNWPRHCRCRWNDLVLKPAGASLRWVFLLCSSAHRVRPERHAEYSSDEGLVFGICGAAEECGEADY